MRGSATEDVWEKPKLGHNMASVYEKVVGGDKAENRGEMWAEGTEAGLVYSWYPVTVVQYIKEKSVIPIQNWIFILDMAASTQGGLASSFKKMDSHKRNSVESLLSLISFFRAGS